MTGAILEDEDAEALLAEDSSFAIEAAPQVNSLFSGCYYDGQIYTGGVSNPTNNGFEWWGTKEKHEGPTYIADILEHGTKKTWKEDQYRYVDEATNNYLTTRDGFDRTREFKYEGDSEFVIFKPGEGVKYFNNDWGGACFAFNYNLSNSKYRTRVYMIGDKRKENGDIEENVLLSYEYWLLDNVTGYRISNTQNCNIFYMYPEGRVKYICFNAKPSDFKEGTFPAYVSLWKAERSQVEA